MGSKSQFSYYSDSDCLINRLRACRRNVVKCGSWDKWYIFFFSLMLIVSVKLKDKLNISTTLFSILQLKQRQRSFLAILIKLYYFRDKIMWPFLFPSFLSWCCHLSSHIEWKWIDLFVFYMVSSHWSALIRMVQFLVNSLHSTLSSVTNFQSIGLKGLFFSTEKTVAWFVSY